VNGQYLIFVFGEKRNSHPMVTVDEPGLERAVSKLKWTKAGEQRKVFWLKSSIQLRRTYLNRMFTKAVD
jgi:hypothetical protein